METKKTNNSLASDFTGIYPAEGLLGMGGFLFYELGCVFVYDDPLLPTLRLHADGFGDDFDVDSSELLGVFSKVPAELVGDCRFSLQTLDFEEGEIELVIKKEGVVVGRFSGISEGLGEAVLIDRKGTLSIAKTKEHNNQIVFEGESGVTSIKFAYGNQYSITSGEPWGGVETTSYKNGAKLVIDVGAGRKKGSAPATFFNDTVDSNSNKMFHSRGGKNVVSKMHFAFKGRLTINDEPFDVCLGQGEDGWYNNWHIASPSCVSSGSGTSGQLGRFLITPKDSYHFRVKIK